MNVNLPMDVDIDFKWEVCQPRKQKNFDYLSPIKRSRVDLNYTDIIKYIPVSNHKKCNVNKVLKKSFMLNINFFALYKYLFVITDFLLSFVLLYVVFQLFFFIQKDIVQKLKIKKYELNKVIEDAFNSYKINRCDKSTRVPALNKVCSEWECTIKNGSIKYTSVLFEVMGDVFNGFIDQVSWKTIGVLSLFFMIYLKFRNK